MKKSILFLLFAFLLHADNSYYEKGDLVQLQKMNTPRDANSSATHYYMDTNGHKMGVTDELLVQCKVGINCTNLLAQFKLTNISKLSDTIFVVKINALDDIFSVSRKLFESGAVTFAHPNFIKERKLR